MLYIANPKAKTARMSKVRTKPQDSPKTNAPKANATADAMVERAIINRTFLKSYFAANVGILALLLSLK